jgi:hypothetical protein
MVALRPFDIFFASLKIRYVAFGNEGSIVPSRPAGHIEREALYRAEGYIE